LIKIKQNKVKTKAKAIKKKRSIIIDSFYNKINKNLIYFIIATQYKRLLENLGSLVKNSKISRAKINFLKSSITFRYSLAKL
jgi:hypothetical protein